MRLFCKCGKQLLIRHEIRLDVLSNFTYIDGKITITKHEVNRTAGLKPFFDEAEVKSAYCKFCKHNIEFAEASYMCDNCGNHLHASEARKIGDTIVVCPRCIKGVENFDVFKIFGSRGPTQKTRDKRVEDAVRSAVDEMPEIPEEVVGMLSGDEEINFSISDAESAVMPPQEYVSTAWQAAVSDPESGTDV